MSNVAAENIQNIRTLKSFANEDEANLKFQIASQELFEYGRSKGYFWALYFMSQRTLQFCADMLIIYIISHTFDYFELNVGEVAAVLLYVRLVMNNIGAITQNIQHVADVFGSSYEIAVLIVAPSKVTYDGKKRPVDEPEAGSIQA